VAEIVGAHGLHGEVKLTSFTANPMALNNYAPLESEDGTIVTIEALRQGKGHLLARIAGVDDRDAAERLGHRKLYIPRTRLPAPEPDEFYHADLIGLRAVTVGGEEMGTVSAVHDFGAGDILELRLVQGGRTMMLPFTSGFVPEIDVAGGRIVVAPPPEGEPEC
jgi:16S rRNA processing protein RimM